MELVVVVLDLPMPMYSPCVYILITMHYVFHLFFFVDDNIIFGRASRKEMETINHILHCYEKASGQKVNFEKSEMTFSPNVSLDVCDTL